MSNGIRLTVTLGDGTNAKQLAKFMVDAERTLRFAISAACALPPEVDPNKPLRPDQWARIMEEVAQRMRLGFHTAHSLVIEDGLECDSGSGMGGLAEVLITVGISVLGLGIGLAASLKVSREAKKERGDLLVEIKRIQRQLAGSDSTESTTEDLIRNQLDQCLRELAAQHNIGIKDIEHDTCEGAGSADVSSKQELADGD